MGVRTGNGIGILLKNIFDPLVIEEPRTIDKIVQAPYRHWRLGFQAGLNLEAGVAHLGTIPSSYRSAPSNRRRSARADAQSPTACRASLSSTPPRG